MRLIFFLFLFIMISCTARRVEPTRASRHAIDTLYQQQVALIQPELDSLCANLREEVYNHAVDSLMNARKAEMNILVE
jgi:hypothetical protein